MSECAECGTPLGDADKNAAGWYRDRCLDCIAEVAADRGHLPPDECPIEDCYVCEVFFE